MTEQGAGAAGGGAQPRAATHASRVGLRGRTLIVGLGRTGLSCARFLAGLGLPIAVTDSREQPPGLAVLRDELPGVALFVGGFNEAAFARADQIVVSPGISLREAPIAAALVRGTPVLGDIELFARCATAPVLAITGSNGKSTVTTLLGEMARAAGRKVRVGGNLGTPALELLADEAPDLYILELSSFQLETTASLNACAAVVLNVTPDHMDRYRDIDEYLAAKQRVYHGDGLMVLNRDDSRVMACRDSRRRSITFGLSEPAAGDYGLRQVDGEHWLARGEELLIGAGALHIAGLHNLSNALAALALGEAAGLSREAMLAALRRFPGLPHRTQWVAEVDGVRYCNDSKGTNIGATVAAIGGLSPTNRSAAGDNPRPLVLIAGGLGKEQDFNLLRPAVAGRVKAVVLIGRDAPLIERALAGAADIHHATDMYGAVAAARAAAIPGDTVLLSPACASFDMFDGYEQRGDMFVDAVGRLSR
jgi:UDP-N-acetylmuramoylalanine--D-glutamate ligase